MSFGDRQYLEAEPVAHIVGQPHAPAQAQAANILRAAYLHGQQNGRMVLEQPYGYNSRDYESDRHVRRSVLPTAGAVAGIARGRRRLRRGQTHLLATIVYAVHSTNAVEVTHTLSAWDGTDGDFVEATKAIAPEGSGGGVGRFSAAGGSIASWNSRYASVPGADRFPYTAGYTPMVDVLELELVNVPTDGTAHVLLYVASRANQRTGGSTPTYTTPVHLQPLYVRVMSEARR